jgi:hypothetical protein
VPKFDTTSERLVVVKGALPGFLLELATVRTLVSTPFISPMPKSAFVAEVLKLQLVTTAPWAPDARSAAVPAMKAARMFVNMVRFQDPKGGS